MEEFDFAWTRPNEEALENPTLESDFI